MGTSDVDTIGSPRTRHPLVLLAVLLSAACAAESGPTEVGPVAVATASDGEVSAELLVRGQRGLVVGRNTIALRLSDDVAGAPITAAAITQAWVMSMGQASHGCPVRDPVGTADDDGLFLATVVLPMASSDGAPWASSVSATPVSGGEHQLSFGDLEVSTSDWASAFTADDGSNYFVSLSFAEGAGAAVDPRVGGNPFVLTVHAHDAVPRFSPADDLGVTVSAEMPSMGHGGAAQASPTHRSDGEYVGRLDLAMPGAWVITFTLTRGGAMLGAIAFDVTL